MSIASEIQRIKNNIAAAYSASESKGANMPQLQNSNNLADTINSISQGGTVENELKFLNFIDCDGTVLYSYTEEEAQELTSLPPLPVKSGCTYQSWNWTLADIREYRFPLTVGASRIPSDGKTRMTFDLFSGDDLTLSIPFSESTGREYYFDWGDGTSDVCTESPAVHTYSSSGRKVVCIDANETYKLCTIMQETAIKLVKLEFGARHRYIVETNLLIYCYALSEVSLPENIKTLDSCSFQNCISLRSLSLPSDFYEISNASFNNCYSLRIISMPKRISTFDTNLFLGCTALRSVSIPNNSRNWLPTNVYYRCAGLQSVYIPSSINSIQNNAFYGCSNLRFVDLSSKTSVPTLENNSAFLSVSSNVVFYVRNAQMLEAFQSATNWSTFASKMQIGGKYAEE